MEQEFHCETYTVRAGGGLGIITVTWNLFIGQAHEW